MTFDLRKHKWKSCNNLPLVAVGREHRHFLLTCWGHSKDKDRIYRKKGNSEPVVSATGVAVLQPNK